MFLVAAVLFGVAAAFAVAGMVTGADRLDLLVGEAFIAAGWVAGLVGLLGLYPRLSDRSRWLARAGGVFAVLGLVAFVFLGGASLAAFVTGAAVERGGAIGGLPLAFVFPGIIAGSLLAFSSFSVASLRAGVHSRTVSVLLAVPSAIFVANVATPAIPGREFVTLGIVCGLALTMFAIGYTLRTADSPSERRDVEPSPDSAAR
ncbi:hypothetical protein [Halomarina oriensis]|uniref:Uncharacterized protein n=1 Tax=Halomarina oriensis TaxID=671145 RepID=A0A6B0GPP8_9EURY|nr:hypothetical protein [Halomarina oriensis]MWG34633.1 hypothetical protein [Halomarina oriensis]